MAKISGLIKLLRPINCLVMSFAIVVGALLAAGLNIPWINMLYGGITAFTLTAAAMAINDYYDYDIDVINEPSRPLPSGAVSKKEAVSVTAIFNSHRISCSIRSKSLLLNFCLRLLIVMGAYSTVGNQRIGR